ncbi:MAG: hypothetical protein IPF99_26060 [Deltaproteobacteria bacterium]|nr:hypothetical protein [Deltaproteobacteria bacterium]
MASLYLFTWNLHFRKEPHDLTVQHLARKGQSELFIACGRNSRRTVRSVAVAVRSTTLQNSRIAVVQPTGKKPRGTAPLHPSDLAAVESHADSDDEFVAALFRLPSSKKLVAVAGLRAEGKGEMESEADRGGSRALLRHAINARRWQAEHRVVLGDFQQSLHNHREIFSWHCFYALSSPTSR